MSKFRVSGNKSSILVYPTVKPELNLDFVNNPEGIDPAYSFTRNSAATYVGPDGYIKTAGVNQPRFDYDAENRQRLGLLIESQRTNSITYSQDLLQSSVWNDNSASGVEQYRQSVAPDGGLSFRVYAVSPNNPRFTYNYTVSIGETVSFYYKAVTSSDVGKTFGFKDENDALNKFIEITLSADWQRFEYTYTTAANNVGVCFFSGSNSGYNQLTATEVLLWGLQVEQGLFPTSYIPTTSSAVTRQPDQLIINKPINLNGTFFIESSISTLKDQQTLFNANDGTNSFVLKNSNGNIAQRTTNYASNNYSTIDTDYTKRIISYQNSKNIFMSSSNIEDSVDAKTPGNLPFTPNKISIGYDNLNADRLLNGYIKKFSYYPKALTDNECRALVSDKQPLNYVAPIVVGGDDIYQINVNGDTYIVHRFLDVGTSSLFLPIALEVEYLIVGGGGGGGSGKYAGAGGGGAGGLLKYIANESGNTDTSPLIMNSGSYTVTVGSGGAGRTNNASITGQGENSVLHNLTAIGGGGGGCAGSLPSYSLAPTTGGSGGGGNARFTPRPGASGTSLQGNAGGDGSAGTDPSGGGGGGGAGEAGFPGTSNSAGDGGDGKQTAITGSLLWYAGGGGATRGASANTTGGLGGGANGRYSFSPTIGFSGTPNTGGGGGAATDRTGFIAVSIGGSGGSGIVIIRYKV